MSTSPLIALRKAIRLRLLSHAPLVAALGGAKIYEEAPQGAVTPYVLFMDAQMRDWSGGESRGAEHFLTLAVISTERGFGAALAAGQQIADLIDEAALSLDGHRLIDLRFVSMDTKRDSGGRFARVAILFRATTEYL